MRWQAINLFSGVIRIQGLNIAEFTGTSPLPPFLARPPVQFIRPYSAAPKCPATAAMTSPPWKEAATLIIVARPSISQKVGQNLAKSLVISSRVLQSDQKRQQQAKQSSFIAKTDYRLLMVKRSGLSSFMASAFVFPGGKVETADYSPNWWGLFEKQGIDRKDLTALANIKGTRPPMVTDPVTILSAGLSSDLNVDYLPADVALRISAIRETFEETGVLLVNKVPRDQEDPPTQLDPVQMSSWREKVRKDGAAFLDLCLENDLCPDVWSLYEWSNWLTPISVGHKRFDTMFYLCCLEKQPEVVLDNTEVTTLKWCTPLEMLEEHSQERLYLAPPQVYELSRLHNLPNFESVKEFAEKRQSLGTERWLPVISTYTDGAISLLPGDDMYPEEPDIIGRKPVPDYPQTLDEMRAKAVHLNRLELCGPTCKAFCNLQIPCGHLTPTTYPPLISEPPIQSGLQPKL